LDLHSYDHACHLWLRSHARPLTRVIPTSTVERPGSQPGSQDWGLEVSVLLMGEWLGSTEDYDRGAASIQKNHGWQGGPQVHIMAPTSEGRFTVVTVWDGRARTPISGSRRSCSTSRGKGSAQLGAMEYYDVHPLPGEGRGSVAVSEQPEAARLSAFGTITGMKRHSASADELHAVWNAGRRSSMDDRGQQTSGSSRSCPSC
jgi:hypothetical protein